MNNLINYNMLQRLMTMSSWMKQVCNGKTVAHCCTKKMDSDEGKTISVEQKTEIQSDIIEQN